MHELIALAIVAAIVIIPLAVARGIRFRWPDFASQTGALTVADSARLSQDVLMQGVYESVLDVSDLALVLPYIHIVGNALTYNREVTPGSVLWRAPLATWSEDTSQFEQVTTPLKIVGGDADVDSFLAQSRSNVNDIRATIIMLKARAQYHEWERAMVHGSGAGDECQGLATLIAANPAQELDAGAIAPNDELDLVKLDLLIDTVRGGKPDVLLMNRRARRWLKELRRRASSTLDTMEMFGRRIDSYDGIPIAVDDYISDTETKGGGTTETSIYALRLGEENAGFAAIYNGGETGEIIQIEDIGTLETKDAKRARVKSYVNTVLFDERSAARLYGLTGIAALT